MIGELISGFIRIHYSSQLQTSDCTRTALSPSQLFSIPRHIIIWTSHSDFQAFYSMMNASLNASVADFLMTAAKQVYGNYGNMTLVWLNSTLGAVFIDPVDTDIGVLNPVIGDLFAEKIFSIPQACAYPISGKRHRLSFLPLFRPLRSSFRSIRLPQSTTLLLLDTHRCPCGI